MKSAKLSAKQKRAGVDLRDVLGDPALHASRSRHRAKATRKSVAEKAARAAPQKSETPPAEFRPIDHVQTTLHDPVRDRWEPGSDEGGVRLYCTSSPITHGADNGRWALQVRAQVKLRGKGTAKHFAVGTASMSTKDLEWLRDLIDAALLGET